jgi:hypothetical protein
MTILRASIYIRKYNSQRHRHPELVSGSSALDTEINSV